MKAFSLNRRLGRLSVCVTMSLSLWSPPQGRYNLIFFLWRGGTFLSVCSIPWILNSVELNFFNEEYNDNDEYNIV